MRNEEQNSNDWPPYWKWVQSGFSLHNRFECYLKVRCTAWVEIRNVSRGSRGRWCSLFQAPRYNVVGSGELRKRKHGNKKAGNSLPFSFFLFPAPPTFRMPFSFASSPLSESLEQAKGGVTVIINLSIITTNEFFLLKTLIFFIQVHTSKVINKRKIKSSVVFNKFYDEKRNKSKHVSHQSLEPDCTNSSCASRSYMNFFHLSIVLRKSFLRKGIRMSKETRRLIEESRQFELSANSNLVPFPSLCRPADFTDFFPRKKKNSLFRLLIKREILTSREVLCNQFLFCNKDDSKKGFFSLTMSA